MTTTPRPDDSRSAQIRSALYNTVAQDSTAPRKRRPLLYVSLATPAALLLGGGGAVLASNLHSAPAPVAAGPTSSPETGNDPVADPVTPTSIPTEPRSVSGVGTPSAVPIEPKTDLEKGYDACGAYAEANDIGTLTPFSSYIVAEKNSMGDTVITAPITLRDGGQFFFVCSLPDYPNDFTVSRGGPVGGN